MAEIKTLARPYARAAFDYAREHDDLESWQQALDLLAQISQDKKVAALLRSPLGTATSHGEQLVNLCDDSLNESQIGFIHILATNRRLPLLSTVYEEFLSLKSAYEQTTTVHITSAHKLKTSQINNLTKLLSEDLTTTPQIEVNLDPTLLAGITIDMGKKAIDGSLKGRMNKLSHVLLDL